MFGRKPSKRKDPDGNPLATRVVRGDDRPTQPLSGSAPGGDVTPAGTPRAAPTTRPSTRPISAEPETRLVAPPDSGGDDASPVGVLLVIHGPGAGRLIAFGAGRNGIGRAAGEAVCIDFGDAGIARQRHAVITFDERNGHFYLQPGDGPALSYLDDEPLLEPRRLASGARLRLGDTELLFRPLVGDDFSWPRSDR